MTNRKQLLILKCFALLAVSTIWINPGIRAVEGISVEDEWNVSGYFDQGENLSLSFWPHADWSLPDYLPGYLPMKIFLVNITDTVGNNYTLFNVTMVPPPEHIPPQPPYTWLLWIYEITVTHHGALLVEDKPEKIGGITKNTGIYTVNCSLSPPMVIDLFPNQTIWIHEASPPPELILILEFPSLLFLPLFMMATLLVLLVYRRQLKKRICLE